MDEPFVGLDPKAVFDIKEVMKDMCKQGKTIFFLNSYIRSCRKALRQSCNYKNKEKLLK